MFQAVLDGLRDIIFPYNCILCHQFIQNKTSPQLCSSCFDGIKFNAPPFCLKCSRHLDIYTNDGICRTCHRYPITFDNAWGIIDYNPTAQKLLHLFKYQDRTSVRLIFAEFYKTFINRYPIYLHNFDAIIPIALHPIRLRERGYNQAELLAKIVVENHSIPIQSNILKRVRHTQIQSILGPKDRWTNLQGAFTINHSSNVKNQSILLIDDLLTTGATASAAANVLKDAGAKRVDLLVIALAN